MIIYDQRMNVVFGRLHANGRGPTLTLCYRTVCKIPASHNHFSIIPGNYLCDKITKKKDKYSAIGNKINR